MVEVERVFEKSHQCEFESMVRYSIAKEVDKKNTKGKARKDNHVEIYNLSRKKGRS